MKTIRFNCSTLQTAVYLTQALRVSVGHNPQVTFVVACPELWHSQLADFLPPEEAMIQFVTEPIPPAFDMDIAFKVALTGYDCSVPRLFLNLFRVVALKMGFTSGLNNERGLLFTPGTAYDSSRSQVLFINERNPTLTTANMDCLIQSISDRRLNITTTQPSRAGNSIFQDGRTLSDYAAIAAQSEYVIGVAGEHMAVAFNRQSINRCRGWFVIDPKVTYPFNDRCFASQSYRDAVGVLKQHELC